MTSTDASLNLQWNEALQILYLDGRANAIDKGIEIEWNEKIKRRMVMSSMSSTDASSEKSDKVKQSLSLTFTPSHNEGG